jgi:heterodisulfide reductase subunit B
MKIGLYPGCSLTGSSREYYESVMAVSKALGIEIIEIPDWNCCGATAAHNLNKELSLSLPARNLAIAEREGLDTIVVPCAACYSRLTVTQHELHHDPVLKARIKEILSMDYLGTSKIMNLIQFFEEFASEKIKEKLVKPLEFKAACYYGCLLVRPPKILNFDRPEDPQSMEGVMKKIGAEPIDWNFKTECCGASMSIAKTEIVGKLSGQIVEDASERGADVIIVACPMCHSNLDMRRPDIEKATGKKMRIPILYLSQAVGLSIGINEKDLGINRHFVKVNLPEKKSEVKVTETIEN